MWSRVRFWIEINTYALLLDALALSALLAAVSLLRTWLVLAVILTIGAIFLAYGGLGVHSTYREKCRMFSVLLRRNRKGMRMESFKDYMSVPCHRMVVRMVLKRIGEGASYSTVKKAYYVPPWKNRFSNETVVRIYKKRGL